MEEVTYRFQVINDEYDEYQYILLRRSIPKCNCLDKKVGCEHSFPKEFNINYQVTPELEDLRKCQNKGSGIYRFLSFEVIYPFED